MSGNWQPEPFAIRLLEQHQKGKTVEQLSRDTGMPVEHIEMSLDAATAYVLRVMGICTTDSAAAD